MNIFNVVFWFLPPVVLGVCVMFVRPDLSWPRRLIFIIVGYATSVFTGIVVDAAWGGSRDMPGEAPILALTTGVLAPLLYCLIFGMVRARMTRARGPEVRASKAVPKGEMNPVVAAAIIQAIASVVVALISLLQ